MNLTGSFSAQEMKSMFYALFKNNNQYPEGTSTLWDFTQCQFFMDISDLMEMAQFTQSERAINEQAVTAFVVNQEPELSFCQEYIMLTKEAPRQYKIFDSPSEARLWIQQTIEKE